MADTIVEQRLNQALVTGIVRDDGRMARIRRIHQRWKSTRFAIVPHYHGAQIKPHRVWRRGFGRYHVDLDLFLGNPQELGGEFRPMFGHGRCHRPQARTQGTRLAAVMGATGIMGVTAVRS